VATSEYLRHKGPVMRAMRCAADVVQYIKVFQVSACKPWLQLGGSY